MDATKTCTACSKDLPLDAFGIARDRADGHNSRCQPCQRAASKASRQRTRISANARAAATRTANIERFRARSRAYWQANSDRIKARQRELAAEYRRRAIAVYGGQCAACGGTDRLEFDHVNGDGTQHREIESNQRMYARIARTGKPLTDYALQLLCHPHHWAKTLQERTDRHAVATSL